MTPLRHLPNALTVGRIALVVPTCAAVLDQRFREALALLLAAGVTDALDGWLAKRFRWQSALGAVLDPLADKLMFAGVFVAMVFAGLVPAWFAAVVVFRDALIVLGALAYRLLIGPFSFGATVISKLNTLMLVAYGLCVLSIHALTGERSPGAGATTLTLVLGAGAFATTLLSGVHYVVVWSGRAWQARRPGDGAAPSSAGPV